MKTLTLTTLSFALMFTVVPAKADTLCGQVTQQIIRPTCTGNEMCAQYFRYAHMLVNGENQIELQTADYDVLTQIVHSDGQAVCVQGQQPSQAKFFEVTSIGPAN